MAENIRLNIFVIGSCPIAAEGLVPGRRPSFAGRAPSSRGGPPIRLRLLRPRLARRLLNASGTREPPGIAAAVMSRRTIGALFGVIPLALPSARRPGASTQPPGRTMALATRWMAAAGPGWCLCKRAAGSPRSPSGGLFLTLAATTRRRCSAQVPDFRYTWRFADARPPPRWPAAAAVVRPGSGSPLRCIPCRRVSRPGGTIRAASGRRRFGGPLT